MYDPPPRRRSSPLIQLDRAQLIGSLASSYPDETKWTVKAISEKTKIGGRVGPTIVGSVKTVADQLNALIEDGDVDGFSECSTRTISKQPFGL